MSAWLATSARLFGNLFNAAIPGLGGVFALWQAARTAIPDPHDPDDPDGYGDRKAAVNQAENKRSMLVVVGVVLVLISLVQVVWLLSTR